MPGAAVDRKRAHPGVHRAPEPEHGAVRLRRHLHLLDMIAAMGRGLVVFAAGLIPLDRASEPHAAEHGDEVGGVGGDLAPEPTPDLRRNHPDLVPRPRR